MVNKKILLYLALYLLLLFGGFLIAPNAHVVVGQADKEYAGQIYAKKITVHQGTRFQWVDPKENTTSNRGTVYARSND